MGMCANGTEYNKLLEVGADKADLFIAVTGSDELNMLSCFASKRMGAKHTVARIRNSENTTQESLTFMSKGLGLSMSINPEFLTAQAIYNIIKLPFASKVETFSSGFEMIEFQIKTDTNLDGKTVSEIRKQSKVKFLICAVMRNGETYIPKGDFALRSGDKLGIIASHQDLSKLIKMLVSEHKPIKEVMILGGGMPSYYLAKKLISLGVDVKIIEKKIENCEFLAAEVPQAVIINGDGSQQELLLEEGISHMDAFVTLTGMDEQNIMLSLFASMQNVPKVVAKINRDELVTMAEKIGVETIISPSRLSTNVIVRYARALKNTKGSNVETLYKLLDGKAEALEFKVAEDSKAIGIPFKEIKLKSNILIAGITRDTQIIIPSGNDMILAGDRVIVIAAEQRLNDLDDILL
jgi:trk system potassium uptake protein TrkA